MDQFKLGQSVTHPLHGEGTVTGIDNIKKLIEVFIPSRMGYVEVHPVSLTPVSDTAKL